MQVFISWSKRMSHGLALALHTWLPEVIHRVEPWMSSEDISKGQRWATEVGARLEETSQGIICVTRENVKEPWLNFEAGALAKFLDGARVRPVLLGVQPSEITGPLTQFQGTNGTDQRDMLKLVKSLNESCDIPLEENRLERSFRRTWDEYEAQVSKLLLQHTNGAPAKPKRDVEDMVAEILETVRGLQRRDVTASSHLNQGPGVLVEREWQAASRPSGVVIGESDRRIRRRGGGELGDMLLPELQSLAASLGISGVARMRKGELISAILEARSR